MVIGIVRSLSLPFPLPLPFPPLSSSSSVVLVFFCGTSVPLYNPNILSYFLHIDSNNLLVLSVPYGILTTSWTLENVEQDKSSNDGLKSSEHSALAEDLGSAYSTFMISYDFLYLQIQGI